MAAASAQLVQSFHWDCPACERRNEATFVPVTDLAVEDKRRLLELDSWQSIPEHVDLDAVYLPTRTRYARCEAVIVLREPANWEADDGD